MALIPIGMTGIVSIALYAETGGGPITNYWEMNAPPYDHTIFSWSPEGAAWGITFDNASDPSIANVTVPHDAVAGNCYLRPHTTSPPGSSTVKDWGGDFTITEGGPVVNDPGPHPPACQA